MLGGGGVRLSGMAINAIFFSFSLQLFFVGLAIPSICCCAAGGGLVDV